MGTPTHEQTMKQDTQSKPSATLQALDPIGGLMSGEEYVHRLITEMRLLGDEDLAEQMERKLTLIRQRYSSKSPEAQDYLTRLFLMNIRYGLPDRKVPLARAFIQADLRWASDQFGRWRVSSRELV